MIESISTLLASLKAATPQILIGVAVFCGVLLFSPPPFIATLGLDSLVSSNRPYLGGGFVAAICILVSQFMWWAKDFALTPVATIRRMRRQARLMSELTPDEKAYLLRYITEQQNTQYFRIDDGIAQGLVAKGIIFQSASVGYLEDGWAYNLQTWARRYLAKRPETLGGANEPPEPLPGGTPSW